MYITSVLCSLSKQRDQGLTFNHLNDELLDPATWPGGCFTKLVISDKCQFLL